MSFPASVPRLNERQLRAKEVRALLEAGATERADLTDRLEDRSPAGRIDRPRVYELPDGRILYTEDPDSPYLDERGDLHDPAEFARYVDCVERARRDIEAGRGDAVSYWVYYSKLGARLLDEVERLMAELPGLLDVNAEALDGTYASLDTVEGAIRSLGVERARAEMYDHLVAYVGEVMRSRLNGSWSIVPADPRILEGAYGYGRGPDLYIRGEWKKGVMQKDARPTAPLFDLFGACKPKALRRSTADEVRLGSAKGTILPADLLGRSG